MKSQLFVTLFIIFSSLLVTGRNPYSGYLTQNLKVLLECNFIAYYNLKENGPDVDSFLDFVLEPEQFYWFVEHYLSVPFRVPEKLKDKKTRDLSDCVNRTWVSEFLLEFKEPDINKLIMHLNTEQKNFLSYYNRHAILVGKFTVFPIKEFHKYCILPPIIKTTIRESDDEEHELTFELTKDEYKIYLGAIGSQVTAIKYLYTNMHDDKRKKELKKIIDNEDDISIICPVYNLKLHYNKDCQSEKTILKCLDNYIRKSCDREIKTEYAASLCKHLYFLFTNLKGSYLDNFKQFLQDRNISLVKPQSVWNVPVFKVYKPSDIEENSNNIESGTFKILNSKNLIFLSFHGEIPKSPYYEVEIQTLPNLSTYADSIADKLRRFFYYFKKMSSPISPVSVEELNHNITEFSFKDVQQEVECSKVQKSLDIQLEVETMKGVVTEKICKIIENNTLTKIPVDKQIVKDFYVIHDDIPKGFRIQCIVLATFVEMYNIIRQILNLESILSLTRYTSLYLHKFFNSVTYLKGNFLYKNTFALKYANACSKAVLHVPSVLYRRNLYISETFLSLYLGLSNLVSSNPSSPFFEYAIIEFLVSYFNKGSEKFVLYLITILSVLHLNVYYYEQIYCHFKEHFSVLKSKMIHPDIASRIIKSLQKLIKSEKYLKMFTLYVDFESDDIFDRESVFRTIMDFRDFYMDGETKKETKLEEISEMPIHLDTPNDGIGYRKEDVLFEVDKGESIEALLDEEYMEDKDVEITDEEKDHKSNFLNILSERKDICVYNKDQELQLKLSKYIGKIREDETDLEKGSSERSLVTSQMVKEREQQISEEMDKIEEIGESQKPYTQKSALDSTSEESVSTSDGSECESPKKPKGSKFGDLVKPKQKLDKDDSKKKGPKKRGWISRKVESFLKSNALRKLFKKR
ncbi:high molecular weight rhoptry protein 3, putative [Plasmodium gallinaceum]|uniref:High molecular weight rhoptry protein 3, putative n=1 Tax=Plasmodium gallinaceum TaxID=5849 RepID=A0A1J1GVV6_PLAGA|nr:high molecular weight rhoptry protein 3, putative [Plasmodium gallinaceum]CRG96598.1 high molecular weight rhoptry protein 3, putative [Plasmodium gallinaceum]